MWPKMGQNAQGSGGVGTGSPGKRWSHPGRFRNRVDAALGLVGMVGFHLEDLGCLFGDALGKLEPQK